MWKFNEWRNERVEFVHSDRIFEIGVGPVSHVELEAAAHHLKRTVKREIKDELLYLLPPQIGQGRIEARHFDVVRNRVAFHFSLGVERF